MKKCPKCGVEYPDTTTLCPADGVALDNIRLRAVEVVPAVSVLIVNGEPSSDHLRDETYLLQTALRPAGRAASGNEPTVIEEHDLEEPGEVGSPHPAISGGIPPQEPRLQGGAAGRR